MDFSEISQFPALLQTAATSQTLSQGEILFHRGEPSQTIYVVSSGQIRLLLYTKAGQSISHYTVRPGEICDEVTLFRETYSCSAIAEESTQVWGVAKQAFLIALQQDPDFSVEFMRQLSHRLHTTKVMVELRSIRFAQERVLHYLHWVVPPEHDTVELKQPLKNIASDLGISPEVLSRTLTKLASDGAIARKKRRITLLELSA